MYILYTSAVYIPAVYSTVVIHIITYSYTVQCTVDRIHFIQLAQHLLANTAGCGCCYIQPPTAEGSPTWADLMYKLAQPNYIDHFTNSVAVSVHIVAASQFTNSVQLLYKYYTALSVSASLHLHTVIMC